MDVYEMDRQRILGITRSAEIQERVQQDAALKAAIAIEQEQRAAAQARQEALAAEAQAIAQADSAAVEKLRELIPIHAQRQEDARRVNDAVSALWQTESRYRAGLSEVNRILAPTDVLIEPSQRGARRESLLTRAGLPSQHIYTPDVQLTTEAQRVGATCVMGITGGFIADGAIVTAHDTVTFDI